MKIVNHTSRISFFIFIIFFFSVGCTQQKKSTTVTIVLENEKAVALSIRGLPDNAVGDLRVQLIQPGDRTNVLGSLKQVDDAIRFEPLVPFTSGLRYEVIVEDSIVAEVSIPQNRNSKQPTLVALYPSSDTVPENLLKVYLQFSEPMVEGNSLQHIVLLNDSRDTMKGTFLDLEPELWNNDGTVFTLWLDPGRIKRDLIPNKELGNPLVAGNRYSLHIFNSWKSKKGIPLSQTHTKSFVAVRRDEKSPDIANWNIVIPKHKTTGPLQIRFFESLDQVTLMEGTRIVDADHQQINGTWQTSDEERTLQFIPEEPWNYGLYTIQFKGVLEDLAGNNLNRPFDRNLEEPERAGEEKEFFTKEFVIDE